MALNILEVNKMIIDIRNPEEYAKGHLEGAINIPFASLYFHPELYLEKDKTYTLYCHSGSNSYLLVLHLNRQGYHCVNLNGGYLKNVSK